LGAASKAPCQIILVVALYQQSLDKESLRRGEASLIKQVPLSFEGEGDTGGEVDNQSHFR
jgi:hypothetical protein